MSTVYRAFDTVLERQVAVKLMHRDMAGHPDQLERFRREARAVAQLNHPHIVQVIDAGEDENMPYIVFEYVEGETLKDRIRRFGRLPVPEAIAYAIEIAWALGAAHDRGIVHRDVKPQNVLVDEEGSAKVTDFGIARTLDQEGLTADGRVLGTTDYVSPEQALGHAVTGQSDLYSLGVVLYEMLTGDVPFHGENQVAVAMKHVREELPDLQYRRPEVSSALAAVLDRMTAKDLAVRYRVDPRADGRPRGRLRDRERARRPDDGRGDAGPPRAARAEALAPAAADARRRCARSSPSSSSPRRPTAAILVLAADRTERGTGAVPRLARRPRPTSSASRSAPRAARGLRPDRRRRRARRRDVASSSTATRARSGAPRPTAPATSEGRRRDQPRREGRRAAASPAGGSWSGRRRPASPRRSTAWSTAAPRSSTAGPSSPARGGSAAPRRSSSRPTASSTATTCCGSPSSRPARTTSRSRELELFRQNR